MNLQSINEWNIGILELEVVFTIQVVWLFEPDVFILPVKILTGKINPDVILQVKLKFYRQNKSRSYSDGKTYILPVK